MRRWSRYRGEIRTDPRVGFEMWQGEVFGLLMLAAFTIVRLRLAVRVLARGVA